jgi:hypothetical protein
MMQAHPSLLLGCCIAVFCLVASPLHARPERIRPGVEYYSDDYVEQAGVRDIAGEKNYEEVYQLYTFYEAVYDAEERVERFKEYERGDVVREDRYRYDAKGKLIEHEIKRPKESSEVVPNPSPSAK